MMVERTRKSLPAKECERYNVVGGVVCNFASVCISSREISNTPEPWRSQPRSMRSSEEATQICLPWLIQIKEKSQVGPQLTSTDWYHHSTTSSLLRSLHADSPHLPRLSRNWFFFGKGTTIPEDRNGKLNFQVVSA